jgi:hypothetical protein
MAADTCAILIDDTLADLRTVDHYLLPMACQDAD